MVENAAVSEVSPQKVKAPEEPQVPLEQAGKSDLAHGSGSRFESELASRKLPEGGSSDAAAQANRIQGDRATGVSPGTAVKIGDQNGMMYTNGEGSTFKTADGKNYNLAVNSDNTVTLTSKSGDGQTFANAKIERVQDPINSRSDAATGALAQIDATRRMTDAPPTNVNITDVSKLAPESKAANVPISSDGQGRAQAGQIGPTGPTGPRTNPIDAAAPAEPQKLASEAKPPVISGIQRSSEVGKASGDGTGAEARPMPERSGGINPSSVSAVKLDPVSPKPETPVRTDASTSTAIQGLQSNAGGIRSGGSDGVPTTKAPEVAQLGAAAPPVKLDSGASKLDSSGLAKPIEVPSPSSGLAKPIEVPSPSSGLAKPIEVPSPSSGLAKPIEVPSPSSGLAKPIEVPSPSSGLAKPIEVPSPSSGLAKPIEVSSPSSGLAKPIEVPSPSSGLAKPIEVPSPSSGLAKPIEVSSPSSGLAKPIEVPSPSSGLAKSTDASTSTGIQGLQSNAGGTRSGGSDVVPTSRAPEGAQIAAAAPPGRLELPKLDPPPKTEASNSTGSQSLQNSAGLVKRGGSDVGLPTKPPEGAQLGAAAPPVKLEPVSPRPETPVRTDASTSTGIQGLQSNAGGTKSGGSDVGLPTKPLEGAQLGAAAPPVKLEPVSPKPETPVRTDASTSTGIQGLQSNAGGTKLGGSDVVPTTKALEGAQIAAAAPPGRLELPKLDPPPKTEASNSTGSQSLQNSAGLVKRGGSDVGLPTKPPEGAQLGAAAPPVKLEPVSPRPETPVRTDASTSTGIQGLQSNAGGTRSGGSDVVPTSRAPEGAQIAAAAPPGRLELPKLDPPPKTEASNSTGSQSLQNSAGLVKRGGSDVGLPTKPPEGAQLGAAAPPVKLEPVSPRPETPVRTDASTSTGIQGLQSNAGGTKSGGSDVVPTTKALEGAQIAAAAPPGRLELPKLDPPPKTEASNSTVSQSLQNSAGLVKTSGSDIGQTTKALEGVQLAAALPVKLDSGASKLDSSGLAKPIEGPSPSSGLAKPIEGPSPSSGLAKPIEGPSPSSGLAKPIEGPSPSSGSAKPVSDSSGLSLSGGKSPTDGIASSPGAVRVPSYESLSSGALKPIATDATQVSGGSKLADKAEPTGTAGHPSGRHQLHGQSTGGMKVSEMSTLPGTSATVFGANNPNSPILDKTSVLGKTTGLDPGAGDAIARLSGVMGASMGAKGLGDGSGILSPQDITRHAILQRVADVLRSDTDSIARVALSELISRRFDGQQSSQLISNVNLAQPSRLDALLPSRADMQTLTTPALLASRPVIESLRPVALPEPASAAAAAAAARPDAIVRPESAGKNPTAANLQDSVRQAADAVLGTAAGAKAAQDAAKKIENRIDNVILGIRQNDIETLTAQQSAAGKGSSEVANVANNSNIDAAMLAAIKANELKESKEAKELKERLLQAEKTKKKDDGKRRKIVVKEKDTLESISKRYLRDVRLVPLIHEINAHILQAKARIKKNGEMQLVAGTILWLPSATEVETFRARLAGGFMPENKSNEKTLTAEEELAERFGEHWDGVSSPKPAAENQISQRLIGRASEADQIRRQNIEAILGPLTKKDEDALYYTCRLGDTLKSIAVKHPALNDLSLWKLIAEINQLTTAVDSKGAPLAKVVRGEKIRIPDADEVADFLAEKRRTSQSKADEFASATTFPGQAKTVVDSQKPIEHKINSLKDAGALMLQAGGFKPISKPGTKPKSQAPTESVSPTHAPAVYLSVTEFERSQTQLLENSKSIENVRALSDDCRIVRRHLAHFDGSRSFQAQLDVMVGGNWRVALVYHVSEVESWCKRFAQDGKVEKVKIQLPTSAIHQMLENDVNSNWQQYRDQMIG